MFNFFQSLADTKISIGQLFLKTVGIIGILLIVLFTFFLAINLG